MSAVSAPALRYHGAKFRIAPWLIGHFPEHRCYVEPYGGAAGVLLRKSRSYAEVYNDLDGCIVNFFRVLRDDAKALIRAVALTPYAREEFDLAWVPATDPIERARRLVVRAQMGFGSAGASRNCTGFRADTKREWSTAQHVWRRYPDALAAIADRLQGVLIEQRPALDVMRYHDSPQTLHYVDPPYVHSTRRMGGGAKVYRHEMSDADHAELIDCIQGLSGMVLLSGYDSDLYRAELKGWAMHQVRARISAGRGTGHRVECLWVSPRCGRSRDLFAPMI